MVRAKPLRATDMTEEQRSWLQRVRAEGSKHFMGETLRIYFPKQAVELKLQREDRIRDALRAGQAPEEVARREGVSRRTVYALRGRLACKFPP